jgi:predicted metalloprotease with PDZ domain
MKKVAYFVTIDLSKPETHRAHVTIRRGSEDLPSVIQFPVWTPGSYLVREYSRHVTLLEPATKISKNRWSLNGNPQQISYEVYCHERTVRTSFLDDRYAALVGATLLPLLHDSFSVEIILPKHWNMLSSALAFKKSGPGKWSAIVSDDDKWIDCPIIASAPGYGGKTSFRTKGITHHIAWVGLDNARPMADMVRDFKKIADTTINMFSGAPFKQYWFLLHFGHKLYGGLEHRDSQLSQFDGSNLLEKKEWDAFLRLIAHEYLHSWNVKSLRPRALGPFDYSCENYTQDIWFAEGLTDYFDDMLVWKAGLIDEAAYWKSRVKDAQLMPNGLPGQKRRSVAESSFDAWIRYYRPDEDSPNTDVSYYSKGSLLGWCWDAHLVKKSKGKWTLARLFRAIWKEFGVDAYENLKTATPGYTREEIFDFAEKITKIPQRKLVESWVMGRKILPWQEAARVFKLKISTSPSSIVFHSTGMMTSQKGSQMIVEKVLSGSAAEAAGISAHDELLALNGTRISDADKLSAQWRRLGKKAAKLLLCRLDRVYEASLKPRPHADLGLEYLVKK